jgi:hypothetical protein
MIRVSAVRRPICIARAGDAVALTAVRAETYSPEREAHKTLPAAGWDSLIWALHFADFWTLPLGTRNAGSTARLGRTRDQARGTIRRLIVPRSVPIAISGACPPISRGSEPWGPIAAGALSDGRRGALRSMLAPSAAESASAPPQASAPNRARQACLPSPKARKRVR